MTETNAWPPSAAGITMDSKPLPSVTLKPRRALPFFSRHPWVFSGAIKRIEGEPVAGDTVTLHASDGQYIATGLFNPDSNIRVRLYSWSPERTIDPTLFSGLLDHAIEHRRRIYSRDGQPDAVRLVFSEADGLSGLTVDRYGEFLLIQLTSLALAKYQDELVQLLREKLNPRGIWMRTEKGIGTTEGLELADGLVWGEEPPRPLFIDEHGIRFGVDVVQGQKTGHYLDQRENRHAVSQLVAGHRVLDLFCYTGGFALAAARGQAQSVIAVDTSAAALETARANAELNECAAQIEFQQSDVYKALEQFKEAKETFDTVIIDPPKMARSRSGLERALRGYFSLNRLGVECLKPDGLLVTCSCSGLIDAADFESMLSSVASQAGRMIQIVEQRGASADHPVSAHCLETRYLQCYVCRVR